MSTNESDDITLGAATLHRETLHASMSAISAKPALTILMHPEPERVGDIYASASAATGGALEVARRTPEFRSPRTGASQPIKEPYTSRQPLNIQWDSTGGAQLSVESTASGVYVNGTLLSSAVEVSKGEVGRGVVLGMGPHVTLLLHHTSGEPAMRETHGLIGDSDAIQRVRQRIERIADMPAKVLIRGETGTGKELVARAIHQASERSEGPFVAVNMANLQEGTAASELFGHARGAFSGADRRTEGYFGAANGGTLLLDEIGETPKNVQTMLLRVLNGDGTNAEVQSVGESRTRTLDVRIITATDVDLEECVESGSFDDALLARLAEYELDLPPLRERRDDLGRLLIHFARGALETAGEGHRLDPQRSDGKPWLRHEVLSRLVAYPWPGNVRELRNTIRQIAFHSRGRPEASLDEALERRLSRGDLQPSQSPVEPTQSSETVGETSEPAEARTRRPSTLTKDDVLEILAEAQWQPGLAAKLLQISKTTLYELMKRFNILQAKELEPEAIGAALEGADGDVARAAKSLKVSSRGLKLRMKTLGLVEES
jgi:two-component system nitrogen regulation response regulator GlnG